jgi:hypothetical protein
MIYLNVLKQENIHWYKLIFARKNFHSNFSDHRIEIVEIL